MTVAIYESADCVRDHNFLPETNTHQPLQQTGNHINFFVKNISFQVFSHLTLCLWCSGSDCVKNRNSRAAAVCLVLLCVLLLTAVLVLCVHIHTKNTNYTEETHQDGLLIKNDNLTKQREQFNQERNELVKSLHETAELLFTDGWLYYTFSLYFISYERKSWTESRKFCTEKGADLIIINSREEQDFVRKIFGQEKVWICLTDSNVEGIWKWVDGSRLTSEFWASGEPNGHRKENCVMSYASGWADVLCNYEFRWICEKGNLKFIA
uniref:C-type lectin domain-containing protein n=1 Tax=Sinocyclocheilus anshuiensis TaxID=1608454 RepID=A0A671P643_9TELE